MDNLPTIFIEAAHRASLFPLASEAAIYAMKAFGEVSMTLPVIIAISGALAGHLFNILLGRWLMKLPSSPKNKVFYLQLQHSFNRFGFIVPIFSFGTLGNILTVAAGMLGTPLRKALPMVALGLLYCYGRLLLAS